MPYSKAEFDLDKQEKFKSAVASAAGTTSDNVDILSITEQRRRAGGIIVETKIRASDETKLEQISESLGSGDVGTKINSELKKQGLSESTGVTQGTSSLESTSAGKENPSMAAAIAGGVVGVLGFAAVVAFCLWRKSKAAKVAPQNPVNDVAGPALENVTPAENVASNQAGTEGISDSQDIESAIDRIINGQPLGQSPVAVVQESCDVENTVAR